MASQAMNQCPIRTKAIFATIAVGIGLFCMSSSAKAMDGGQAAHSHLDTVQTSGPHAADTRLQASMGRSRAGADLATAAKRKHSRTNKRRRGQSRQKPSPSTPPAQMSPPTGTNPPPIGASPPPAAGAPPIEIESPSAEAEPPTVETEAPVQLPPPPTSPETPTVPTTPPPTVEDRPAIPTNAYYVSATTGKDSNQGTQTSPWQTITKAISAAPAGSVVVIEPGIYGARGTTLTFSRGGTAAAPIVFTSPPGGPRPLILGYVRVIASHLRLDSLAFEGPTGRVAERTAENPGGEQVQVSIMYGTDIELSNSEVLDNAWHAGVFVSSATDVRVVSNYIHDNGDIATGPNLDHGIYWCSGSGLVAGNRIEGNIAWGVHLYPTATGVTVTRNSIVDNGKGGVIIALDSAQNLINRNIVTDNGGYGIRAYNLTGAGNVAEGNITWNNGQNLAGIGIAAIGNLVTNPATLELSILSAYGGE